MRAFLFACLLSHLRRPILFKQADGSTNASSSGASYLMAMLHRCWDLVKLFRPPISLPLLSPLASCRRRLRRRYI